MNSSKKYKILFISSWFPNKLEPTNGNFVQRHAEAVAHLHEVEILHAIGDFHQKERFLLDDQIINGIRTLIVYYRNSKIPALNFLRRMKAYRLGFKRMQKPDLVHGNVLQNHLFFAVYLKEKFKIPFVVSEHWSMFLTKKNRKQRYLAKLIASHAKMILPVSHELMKSIKENNISVPMKVIGNVVNTEIFKIENAINEKFIFLHISSLIPLKNPDKIIKVSIKLHDVNPNFELHIGGDGDENRLKNLIKQNNAEGYVKTFGILTMKEVSQKMKDANCFILFSEIETQGIVLLEAFASGVPVIATRVGGIPEIVNHERGILIEKGNEKELLTAMQNVLEGSVSFAKSEELRNYCVDHFSKQKIAEQFSEVYNLILK